MQRLQSDGILEQVTATRLLISLILGVNLPAQVAPVVEVFGGYSYFRLPKAEPGLTAANLNGWSAAVKLNVRERVGLVVDVGGNYGTRRMVPTELQRVDTFPGNYRQHTVLFGPEVRVPAGERFTVNVRALIGAAYIGTLVLPLREPFVQPPPLTGEALPPLMEFTFGNEKPVTGALGGSLDYRLSDRLAWRVVQPELVVIGLGGTASRKCARISTGLVFTF